MDTLGATTTTLDELARRLQTVCIGAGLTVATAESCTGGLVAHAITSVAGASGYFVGGVVSYSNAVKASLLDVDLELLATHGAVSAEVAVAMATGVRQRLASDLGVGITGVAGPDGGTSEKPVGLVYVAVADRRGTAVRWFRWPGDRSQNIHDSAVAALELLVERAIVLATPVQPPSAADQR